MMLEKDIIWLNTLRQKNPDAYKRKLRIMGITDEDVPYHEIKAAPGDKRNRPYKDKKFSMGGKPYVGESPAGFMPKLKPGKKFLQQISQNNTLESIIWLMAIIMYTRHFKGLIHSLNVTQLWSMLRRKGLEIT